MITTKNNFKGYLRKHYPSIASFPVYGQPMYIMDGPLSDIDNYTYNVQQLPNGKYVAFIGISIDEAITLLAELKTNGIPRNGHVTEKKTAPTTFSCFEAWLERHNITPLNRTFCNNMSPEECFHSSEIAGCKTPQQKGIWYMYELPGYVDRGEQLSNIPHITIEYPPRNSPNPEEVVIVLIKASASRYKSKKQRFIEKFQFMQPIYEKLIAACAVANSQEHGDWSEAKLLCEQYMNTQFETEGTVDIEQLKEAYKNGTLGLFTRNLAALHIGDNAETF